MQSFISTSQMLNSGQKAEVCDPNHFVAASATADDNSNYAGNIITIIFAANYIR
jgi:hypothetical protein